MKVPVITTDKFILYIEEYSNLFFIHCDVLTKWTKETKKELQQAFSILVKNYKELYATHSPEDKKHKKFLKMFNFSYLQSIKGNNGNDYDVYIWR